MRHDIHIEGTLFALRPVARDDAALILRLRSDPVRTRYLHPIVPTVEAQQDYLDRYFEREGDYYFVIEHLASREPDGLIGLYNLDASRSRAEIGRWVLRDRSLAAIESIWLLYRVAFEVLGLDEVYCRTVVESRRAVSFHDSCGVPRCAILADHVLLNGQQHDVIEHALTRAGWPTVAARLAGLARSVA